MSEEWNREEEPEEETGMPRYDHYIVQTGSEEPKLPAPKKEKRSGRGSGQRTLKSTVTAGVIFGLVAGVVFQAVNFAADRIPGLHDSSPEEVPSTEVFMRDENSGAGYGADNLVVSSRDETGTVASVADAVMPAVVAITSVSIQEIPTFFGYRVREYPSTGSGSGIIVGENEEELLIATNNHVVAGADTLTVCFIGNDVVNAEQETLNLASGDGDINVENAVTAKIKGTDPEHDLAVVAVKKQDIPESTMGEIRIVQLGSSLDLTVGEQVVAIGNALGYGQSVTSGWISAIDRSVSTDEGISTGLIQTDAAINPGNSGGPLLNMQAELIGINTSKYMDNAVEGMGYAIPLSSAQPILEELMNRQTREKVSEDEASYLGVEGADLSLEATEMYNMPAGVFVIDAPAGGPAADAGIRRGDIIVRFDGQKVTNKSDLAEKLTYYAAGETVEVVVARPGEGEYVEQSVEVTLSARTVR